MNHSQSAPIIVTQPEQMLCVLGMHRSGTSCLTGSLQEAGLSLGDCHTWNPHNLKGNRENQDIVDINDRILADNNGAWDQPPVQAVWTQTHREQVRQLFQTYAEHPLFGFKDPRTLLVLDGWKTLFPDMRYIGIFRHPNAVAQSLHNRSGMPREQGLELWHEYNLRLLRHYRQAPCSILSFDDDPADFQHKLHQVLISMGFDAHEWEGEFYDGELRSAHGDTSAQLPWKIRRLYRKLLRLAE